MLSIVTSLCLLIGGNVECRDLPASTSFPVEECALRLQISTAVLFKNAMQSGWPIISYSVECRNLGKPA